MSIKILCVGEVLWDVLPTGNSLGGAPFNVAYHLKMLGHDASILSRVGNDELGNQIIDKMKIMGMSTDLLQFDKIQKTGTVEVTLDSNRNATYQISEPVAWDYIEFNPSAPKSFSNIDYLIFGTLAQRNKITRMTIKKLKSITNNIVYDINLRPPYINKEIIEESLLSSDIVKMNEEEFYQIANMFRISKIIKIGVRALSQKFDCSTICITKGANGALLYRNNNFYEHKGFQVKVKDSVGSGDAFLGALISGIINGKDNNEILSYSNAVGAHVAMNSGGTPTINLKEIYKLLN